MEKLVKINIEELFSTKDKKSGIEKYAEIMRNFSNTNVETDKTFQKRFNGFYRVRRNSEWQGTFYKIMEEGKQKESSFDEILLEIYKNTGRVEASFASKLLHTLNTDMPIWDKFVLQNLNLKMPICSGEKKLENAISIYKIIIDWYQSALSMSGINQKIVEFDQIFTEYKWFSKTKKLDFLLWQMR